jgi:molecular chaperone GrpE
VSNNQNERGHPPSGEASNNEVGQQEASSNAGSPNTEERSKSEARLAEGMNQTGLEQALNDAKMKVEENWNLFLRARADLDNYRRRAEIDIENARKYSLERFARELLAVVDSLEHGLAVAESEHDSAYREGMALTKKLLLDIFEKFGIAQIDPLGEVFDPIKHEAISMQASNEVEPNRVLVVAQKGFMLHDRVLRPARVVVSRD